MTLFANPFRRRAATRIALVSLLLAAVAGPLAGYVEREVAEDSVVALAIEESGRLLRLHDATDLSAPDATEHAAAAARSLAGGLFDIAELYDRNGQKVAEAATAAGHELERRLPRHTRPDDRSPYYESLSIDGAWVLRVFVPLPGAGGYFEGVRRIPEWQRAQIRDSALGAALMVSLAALLCGTALYPVVVRLSEDNERKAREVLDSHIAMMEALGRAIAKRDSDTGAHNYRVAWITACIGERLGFTGQSMQALIAGAFLHDVGKIGIPDAILLKPGRLDAQEFETMRTP